MQKIFWDKDNIGFIGDRVNSAEHSHCVLQIFLSLDAPMRIFVNNMPVDGKCIVVNKNVRHAFSCDGQVRLSVLIEPTSNFAKSLSAKMNGDHAVWDDGIDRIQSAATRLIYAPDSDIYISFVDEFAEYLGADRKTNISDERIERVLEMFSACDCYDHTIEHFANAVALSPSRLSHLFAEQMGVPLKSYILFHQLERAFTELFSGKSVTDAAMLAGFDSPSHFAATAKMQMGMPCSASIKDSEFLKVFI